MERKYLTKKDQERLIKEKGLNKPFDEFTSEQQEELADIMTSDEEQVLWEAGQLGRDDEHVERSGFKVDVAIPKPKERSNKIALRIETEDLEAIKIIGTQEGLRYQTYIKSVLKKEILSRRRAEKKT